MQSPSQSGIRIQEEQNDFISQLKKSSHFPVILLDMLLKVFSILFFLLAKILLGDSFIVHFVVITALLAVDFWYVKNVTGRKLVGMRWWSEPSADGAKSTYQFENMICVPTVRFRSLSFVHDEPWSKPTRGISGVDATWFWAGLIAMTVFWLIMAIVEITRPGYCILCLLGIAFSGGNLWGFFQCRRWGNAELAAMKAGGVASAISDVTSTIASGFLSVINKV